MTLRGQQTDVPLETRDLSVGYEHPALVEGLNLRLEPGQMVAMVGPNGAGKTTLLNTLAGLRPPLSGAVLVGGRDLGDLDPPKRARRVALLPQMDRGDPTLTVHELVSLGRTPHLGLWGALSADDRRAVDEALDACDLTALARRPLAEISGGERQRARIGLTLAQSSPLLLLDEPANHLDLRRRYDFFALLSRLRRRRNLAVVVVLHDLAEAFREADRVLLLYRGRAVPVGAADPDRTAMLAEAFGVPTDYIPR